MVMREGMACGLMMRSGLMPSALNGMSSCRAAVVGWMVGVSGVDGAGKVSACEGLGGHGVAGSVSMQMVATVRSAAVCTTGQQACPAMAACMRCGPARAGVQQMYVHPWARMAAWLLQLYKPPKCHTCV